MATLATITAKLPEWRFRALLIMGSMAGMAGAASAEAINWTPISEILDGLGTEFLPSLLTLVFNALPIIIALSIIGFIIGFLDKIIAMIKV